LRKQENLKILSSEVEAQKEIARLGYEEARLLELKQLAEAELVRSYYYG
jgi:hypothetical protein